MRVFTNFETYTPEDPFLKGLQTQHGVSFFKDSEGIDWYELQKGLDPEKTIVVCDKKGSVRGFSKDPSTLCPILGGIVIECEEEKDLFNHFFDEETKTFSYVEPSKTLSALLKELRLLEIKLELGDSSVESEILSLKQQIVKLS